MNKSILYSALFFTHTTQAALSAPQGFTKPLCFETQELFRKIALAYKGSTHYNRTQALEALNNAPENIKNVQDWIGCIKGQNGNISSLYHTPTTYAQACGLIQPKKRKSGP